MLIEPTQNSVYVAESSFCKCTAVENIIGGQIREIFSNDDIMASLSSAGELKWSYIPKSIPNNYTFTTARFRDIHDVAAFNPVRQNLARLTQPRHCYFPKLLSFDNSTIQQFQVVSKTSDNLTLALPAIQLEEVSSSIFNIVYV